MKRLTLRRKPNKYLLYLLSYFLVFLIIWSSYILFDILILNQKSEVQTNEKNLSGTSGIWIASISNTDFPSTADLTGSELDNEIDSIVEVCLENKINTIFFQVRPSCDALYDSDIFPVSKYLSSNGKLQSDVLSSFIDKAHDNGIKLYAWVNPSRITNGSLSNPLNDVSSLPHNSPAYEHNEWVVNYADCELYFNLGIPEVRKLVVEGVKEIVKSYDVDGIVFDDYFYPYQISIEGTDGSTTIAEFEDSDAYNTYGNNLSLDDWRRSCVNDLIKETYNAIKTIDQSCMFGVSPFGIWKNIDYSGGSTTGLESFYSIYCDSVEWAEGNYVDFLAPQLYWSTDSKAAPFKPLCDWWQKTLRNTETTLMISFGAYRYSEDDSWDEDNIITNEMIYSESYANYGGNIFFGYDEIKNNTGGVSDEIKLHNNSFN